jgi:2,4-dienoyl-CoA reductase-like NADH-dependent reductase (Old Yellow Enzyme family)
MSKLFEPYKLRDVTFRNRIGVSPMCMYSSVDGMPSDWHLPHLAARAVGGAALVIQEATAVLPEGRISPADAGLWDDAHVGPWAAVVRGVVQNGAVAGVQLAHAGRKAGTAPPWDGGRKLTVAEGGWQAKGPTTEPFPGYEAIAPAAMTEADIRAVIDAFAAAARRSLAAGYQVVEVHGAHGYLLHSFYSPLSNTRTDAWGGSFDGRTRLIREVTRAVRNAWPESLPLFVRLSTTDWADGGWTIEDSVSLAKRLKEDGADLIDCSSGGNARTHIPVAPGYQVPGAEAVRRNAGIATAAVGKITDPHQAEEIVAAGKADFVLLARELLRDPHWPLRAAKALGVPLKGLAPKQYERAW